MTDLAIHPCQSLCAWSATGERRDGFELFACAGCGSEWVAGEQWTPADHTGAVPDAVLRERRRLANDGVETA
jgi:ribosomal protein L37AE/L43A